MLADDERDAADSWRETVEFLAHYVDFAPRDVAPGGAWGESPVFFEEARRPFPPPWLRALWRGRRRAEARRRAVTRRRSSPGS